MSETKTNTVTYTNDHTVAAMIAIRYLEQANGLSARRAAFIRNRAQDIGTPRCFIRGLSEIKDIPVVSIEAGRIGTTFGGTYQIRYTLADGRVAAYAPSMDWVTVLPERVEIPMVVEETQEIVEEIPELSDEDQVALVGLASINEGNLDALGWAFGWLQDNQYPEADLLWSVASKVGVTIPLVYGPSTDNVENQVLSDPIIETCLESLQVARRRVAISYLSNDPQVVRSIFERNRDEILETVEYLQKLAA